MKHCYLAGPMRGIREHNFPAFFHADEWLTRRGWYVLNPARMDIVAGFDPSRNDPNKAYTPEEMREFARRDTNAILSLRGERGDALFLLPGWEQSRGVAFEKPLAEFTGLLVFRLTKLPHSVGYFITEQA